MLCLSNSFGGTYMGYLCQIHSVVTHSIFYALVREEIKNE